MTLRIPKRRHSTLSILGPESSELARLTAAMDHLAETGDLVTDEYDLKRANDRDWIAIRPNVRKQFPHLHLYA